MPTVVPASQIFQVVEDGADSTPVSTAAASFTVHRQSAVAPQPYRGFVARPATAPPQQPQARPPKRPSTPKVRSLLASTAPKPKYHGLRSDGVRELLEGRKPHPADPKSIDHRPPRPSASRRLARTTPHLPAHPSGHTAGRPLDATGVQTLHRQLLTVIVTRLPAPQLASCASSGRAWWPGHALPPRRGAIPLGPRPLPRLLELAASQAAHPIALASLGHACASATAPCPAACRPGLACRPTLHVLNPQAAAAQGAGVEDGRERHPAISVRAAISDWEVTRSSSRVR